jgi:uncharacterized protein YheU (UPF0270 family)
MLVPHRMLSPDALHGIIEAFITVRRESGR